MSDAPVTWSRVDEATLVRILTEEKAKGNWSNGNPKVPKNVVWTACELALKDSERKSGGNVKTIEPIKSRWQRLKQEFNTVKDLREFPGFTWNDQEKIARAPDAVWVAYVITEPNANKFRKKRFPLYDAVAELVDGTRVTGNNAPRPDQNAPQPGQSAFRPGQYAFRAGQTSAFERSSSSLDSYDYSSSEDDEPATPAPPLSDRKRSRSPGNSASPCQKMRRVSPGQGMSEMAGALREMAEVMSSRLASKSRPELPTSSTDDPQTMAITALEKNGGLSGHELAEAVHYFMRDRDLAKAYIALKTGRARSYFLQYELEARRKKL